MPRKHCYSNAAPGEMAGVSSACSTAAEVFTFNNSALAAAAAASSSSQSPSAGMAAMTAMSPGIYSNMASPSPALLPMTPFSPPPSVNRTLKPKNPAVAGADGAPAPPPSINRQLKPLRNL